MEGLDGVGFVAHVDFNPLDHCYGRFDPRGYRNGFRRALGAVPRDGPVLTQGIEVGEPHRFATEVEKATSGYEYDFVIGALHWVGKCLVLEKEPFLAAADPLELVEEYYRESVMMCETARFDSIAHVGIFRRGLGLARVDVDFDETKLFPQLLDELLRCLIDRGVSLELNTSGLRRRERTTYPTVRVLRRYHDLGGRLVSLGSDSHREPWIFHGLETGSAMLREVGFVEAFYFRRGDAVGYPLG